MMKQKDSDKSGSWSNIWGAPKNYETTGIVHDKYKENKLYLNTFGFITTCFLLLCFDRVDCLVSRFVFTCYLNFQCVPTCYLTFNIKAGFKSWLLESILF